MRNTLPAVCLLAALGVAIHAQAPSSPAVFEVATIKQNKSGEQGNSIRRLPGGRVSATNMAPRDLVMAAYQLNQFTLAGGPSWIENDRFDILAKMEGNPEWGGPGSDTPDPYMLALRALLVERFKLKLHKESREIDVYALTMVKPGTPGPALKLSPNDCKAMMDAVRRGLQPPPRLTGNEIPPCGIRGRIGMIQFDGFPMSQAAEMLTTRAGRIVLDRTGLSGNWQFVLTHAQDARAVLPPGADVPAPNPDAPSLFTALQEQLGLKLEATKAPVQVTVIDSIERPTED
jgi:uncharacterized protein (TIGR03435 family)